jgi:hypothetical protein
MHTRIVCNIMSLDGYYTGPGNNVMMLPMDAASTPIVPSGCAKPMRCCLDGRPTKRSGGSGRRGR